MNIFLNVVTHIIILAGIVGMLGFIIKMIVGMLIPLMIGVLVAWYCLDAMGRQSNLPGRIVILISTFILTLFADVYVAVIKVPSSTQIDTNLLPNLTFVIGLLLFVVFNVKKQKSLKASK